MSVELSPTPEASRFKAGMCDFGLSFSDLPKPVQNLIPRLIDLPHVVSELGILERDDLVTSGAGEVRFALKPSESFLTLLAAARARDFNIGVVENLFGHDPVSVVVVANTNEERASVESQGSAGASPQNSQALWRIAIISESGSLMTGGRAARVAASSLDPNSEIGGLPRGDAGCVRATVDR